MSTIEFKGATPVYVVHDVKASVQWYLDALGFKLQFLNEPPGEPAIYAVLVRDSLWSHLCYAHEGAKVRKDLASAQLHITNLDEFFQALTAKRVNVVQEPQDQFWGERDFIISDPDGNQLWFSEPGQK